MGNRLKIIETVDKRKEEKKVKMKWDEKTEKEI